MFLETRECYWTHRNVEVDEEYRDKSTSRVDPTNHRPEVGLVRVVEIWQGEGDRPGTDPESGCSDGHDLRLVLSGSELSGTSPRQWTPSQVEGTEYGYVATSATEAERETRSNSTHNT